MKSEKLQSKMQNEHQEKIKHFSFDGKAFIDIRHFTFLAFRQKFTFLAFRQKFTFLAFRQKFTFLSVIFSFSFSVFHLGGNVL